MIYFIFLGAVFGLIIGSFLNCLMWRIHKEESAWGRSYCPKCSSKIAWYDNIPVISFMVLKGKCRVCRDRISFQYPAVEASTAALFALTIYVLWPAYEPVVIFKYLFAISIFIFVFVYDLRWYLILDRIMLPSILILFLVNLYLGVGFWDILLAGSIGGGFFLLQFLASGGKWIGGGDIRLGAFMGVLFGNWTHILISLFISYMLGAVAGIFLIILGNKKWSSRVPFGVFLSMGGIATLLFAKEILAWYMDFLLI